MNPADFLHRNECYSYFATLDRLNMKGPPGTNVNDFCAIYVPTRTKLITVF